MSHLTCHLSGAATALLHGNATPTQPVRQGPPQWKDLPHPLITVIYYVYVCRLTSICLPIPFE